MNYALPRQSKLTMVDAHALIDANAVMEDVGGDS